MDLVESEVSNPKGVQFLVSAMQDATIEVGEQNSANCSGLGSKSTVTVYKEAELSVLVNVVYMSQLEAYDAYNKYAFSHGFGVRVGKVRRIVDNSICSREYVCSSEGFKNDLLANKNTYNKYDYRCGCKAMIRCHVDREGRHTVGFHEMCHSHDIVALDQRHLIRSHRKVGREQLNSIKELKSGGVGVSDCIRVLSKEVGGSPNLGFTKLDVYNALARDKAASFDGCDTRNLLNMFSLRQDEQSDFYYDMELDSGGHLVSFFFRDSRMRRDFEVFGDSLGFDTTYRTNKYGMICGPFVGINNHANNVMFGMGFLLNERIESFVWLFKTFTKSMGGLESKCIMTDQCASMAAAIAIVWPNICHRLCTWHITENSKKNIPSLRLKDGFQKAFNYALKYTDTIAEFEHYWSRLLVVYKCADNKWLNMIYELRHKWCAAYSKDVFSGGVISSQRSETTNESISHRLNKTSGLSDFYCSFVDVIGEWRSRENKCDFRSSHGKRYLAFKRVKLLMHARKVYTNTIACLFEEEFITGTSCDHELLEDTSLLKHYRVWRTDCGLIKHQVWFYEDEKRIECTCKMITDMGILCSHSLRVFHLNCVNEIPERYILSRWRKDAWARRMSASSSISVGSSICTKTVWRSQMSTDFIRLIHACQGDVVARSLVDVAYADLKREVEKYIGSVDSYKLPTEVDKPSYVPKESLLNVKDPVSKRAKGDSNLRPKFIIEKKGNKVKGWKKKKEAANTLMKSQAQASLQLTDDLPVGGSFVHPKDSDAALDVCVPDDYFGVSILCND